MVTIPDSNRDKARRCGRRISANEYLELALSNRKLERITNATSDFVGLEDPLTGEKFFVDRQHLLDENARR